MHRNTFILASFFLAAWFPPSDAASQGSAEQDYPYAYLNHVDGNVTLQRASEPDTEPATSNVPILPGDRVWTERSSRAEIVFADGNRLRLSEGTKIDVVELESETLLRLWSGSVILRLLGPTSSLRIDSPAGSVSPTSAGTYRLDLDRESLALSVSRGSAELRTSRGGVLVQTGETSRAFAGELPEIPVRFNTARFDDFDRWSDELDRLAAARDDIVVRSLPHAVQPYVSELSYYGNWQVEPDIGYVWYPQVSVGWAPYRYGRWCNTWYGQTWVSYDPWGWAPHHYGRWGHHGTRGWYWVPGASFSPAWVSFAIGPFWVGWSPLGVYNRPVFGGYFHHEFDYRGGRPGKPHHYPKGGGWNYVSRDHFGSRTATARLDESLIRASASQVELLDAGTVLDRNLSPRRARARAVGPATEPLSYRRLERTNAERLAEGTRASTTRFQSDRGDGVRSRGAVGRATPTQPGRTWSGSAVPTPRERGDEASPRASRPGERPNRGGLQRASRAPRQTQEDGSRRTRPEATRARDSFSTPSEDRAATRSAPREAWPATGNRGRQAGEPSRGGVGSGERSPSRATRDSGASRSPSYAPSRGSRSGREASPRASSPERTPSRSRATSREQRTMSGGGAGDGHRAQGQRSSGSGGARKKNN